MTRTIVLSLAILACLAQSRDGIKRPEFLKTHSIYSARSEMLFSVRIVPHKDIRTVIVEAWELEEEQEPLPGNDIVSEFVLPATPTRVALRRSSLDDAEPERSIYTFTWRAGLDVGTYHLIAKLYLGRGIHVESTPKVILVR